MAYYKRFSAYTIDSEIPDILREASGANDDHGKYGYDFVAYMWSLLLLWGDHPNYDASHELWESWGVSPDSEDSDMPDVYRYDVTMLDVLYFPELSDTVAVYLYEDSYGFVEIYERRQRDSAMLEFWGV